MVGLLALTLLFSDLLGVGEQPREDSDRAHILRSFQSSGYVDWSAVGTPSFSWSLDQAVAATVTPEIGPVMTKASNPVRLSDGTYPAGLGGAQGFGHKVSNGTYWYATDADCAAAMEPAGDFSACVVVTPLSISTNNFIFMKYNATANRTWYIYGAVANTVNFRVSDDGTTVAGPTVNSSFYVGKTVFICATYDYISPGGSNRAVLYVDNLTPVTSVLMRGPPYDSSANCFIGASSSGFYGIVHHAVFWNGLILTADQVAALRNEWYGTTSAMKSPLNVTSVAPPNSLKATAASGTEAFLIGNTSNMDSLGPYGLYVAGPYTNRVTRAGFESCSSGNPVDWTVVETAGTGSAAVDCDTTTYAAGFISVKTVLTGSDSLGAVKSLCRTDGIAADLAAFIYAKKSAGTSISNLYIEQFTTANNCTGAQTDTNITSPADLTTSWVKTGAVYPAASWAGGTQSYRIVWQETCDGGCTSYIDSAHGISGLKALPDSTCTCDTDLDCTCDLQNVTFERNPLTVGSWTISANVRTPFDWGVAVDRYIAHVPGTSGNNNEHRIYTNADVLYYDCYDSAGVQKKAQVAAAGNADTTYKVVAQRTATGDVRVCFEDTCGSWATGCIQDGLSTTFRLGHDGTTAGEWWIKDFKVTRRVVGP